MYTVNGRCINFEASIILTHFDTTTASDASGTGLYMAEIGERRRTLTTRAFSVEEMKTSSTRREMEAVYDFFVNKRELARSLYAGRVLRHLTDNKAVVQIMNTGSKKRHLHQAALEILLVIREDNIKLELEWVPWDNDNLQEMDETCYLPCSNASGFCFHP